jgi:peptidoglycan/xylan/chitin deacetylase (PgdA/CDA1 family)
VAGDTAFVTAFTNEGAATLTFHAVDGVGNIEADQTISLLIDKTPPVSTLSGADDSWHSGPVTLSLSAVDSAIGTDYPDGSGVHSVWYRIDGNPAVETPGAGPVSITVDSDGAHYVTYWATDNAGNSEAPRMVSVRIAGLPVPPNLVSYTGTQISSFDSATEWTVSSANGASGTESEDTVHFREGTGSLQLTTGIAGGEVVVQKTINQDMSSMLYGGRVRFWVYLPRDWQDTVSTFRVRFSPDPLFSRSFYYTNSDMTGMHEGWNLISVGASSFLSSTVAPSWTDTMVAVRMEVCAKTGQTTTVGFDDLRVGVVTTPAVLFSFDDDDVSVYNSAYPILQRYGIAGTAYVPSADVGSSSGKMNLTQLQDLYAHGWDIANHTVNHTNLTTVDLATAESELRGCADFLIQNGMPRAARDVAYPYGAYNPTVLQAMSETGMLTGRLVDYRPMALPIAEPYMIPACSTNSTKWSVGDIEARIDRAVNNGGVIELYFHAIGETTDSYTQSVENLTQICQYVHDMGIPTMTISQLREDSFGSPESIPPVTTTDYDGLWHNGPVTLHFTATDVGSGVYYTEYSLDGGSTWTAGTSTTVSTLGQTTVLYRSLDKAGNVEAPQTCTVKIDTTGPVTTASGAGDAWHNTPVTVYLTASDPSPGSGVAATYYTLDGGPQTKGTSVTVAAPTDHSKDGTHTITYWSVDNAGNVEAPQTCTVKIDTTGPVTTASLTYAKVNHVVRLLYKATDNLSPKVKSVKVVVKNSHGKTVKTIWVSTAKYVGTWIWYAVSWTPKAKGTYRYYVYAKDLAGNAQSVRGWAKVIVK